MRKQAKKGPSYLDVTEYIVSGPFSPKVSPCVHPVEPQLSEVLSDASVKDSTLSVIPFNPKIITLQNITPLSRPLYIEVQQGRHSPYLKELLSKVGSSEIQFFDFTLDRHNNDSEDEMDEQFRGQEGNSSQGFNAIPQEQEGQFEEASFQHKKPENEDQVVVNPDEYIPNMHLLEMDPSFLTLKYFKETLTTLKSEPQQQRREFILLYLTDRDLETYQQAPQKQLVKVVGYNLETIGFSTRLERKARVARYLQKKQLQSYSRKRRIWKKKINYDCRKKVADNRLRVKGKFVTREQACSMLGIELCPPEDIKQLLKQSHPRPFF